MTQEQAGCKQTEAWLAEGMQTGREIGWRSLVLKSLSFSGNELLSHSFFDASLPASLRVASLYSFHGPLFHSPESLSRVEPN